MNEQPRPPFPAQQQPMAGATAAMKEVDNPSAATFIGARHDDTAQPS
jgi:hypothetical protein